MLWTVKLEIDRVQIPTIAETLFEISVPPAPHIANPAVMNTVSVNCRWKCFLIYNYKTDVFRAMRELGLS